MLQAPPLKKSLVRGKMRSSELGIVPVWGKHRVPPCSSFGKVSLVEVQISLTEEVTLLAINKLNK